MSELNENENFVNKGAVIFKCKIEGGENREQVLFSFSLCGVSLTGFLFLGLPVSVEFSSRSLRSLLSL